uniref:Pectinesterase n=1 Tax=Kalanchoe fedtschenkoi TaxID=63787 RepID=A0A7N0VCX2_KALFE
MKRVIFKWLFLWVIWGCALRLMAFPTRSDNQSHVHSSCSKTRYPALCVRTLMSSNQNHADHSMSTLVDKVISETAELPSSALFSARLEDSAADHPHHLSIDGAREYCSEAMNLSLRPLKQSAQALKKFPDLDKQDIQTWLSAALTLQQGCLDEIISKSHSYQNRLIADKISHKVNHLVQLSSIALALVNKISTVKVTKTRAHQTSEATFPSWVSVGDRKFIRTNGQTDNINAVVAQDGSGDHETIKEAINAAPSGKRYVIYIKAGVYKEQIKTNKDGITLIGEGKYSTIIVASNGVEKDDCSLEDSATFTTTGDRFIAVGMSFQNSAGPRGGQAIALHVSSDHAIIYNCSIVSYQDSLYAKINRQFYKNCDIMGTIDFIFGEAAAVFQNCNLLLRKPEHKQYNVILASGRSHPEQNSGFSVLNCKIRGAAELDEEGGSCKSYLGRPWKRYSRSVVINSEIGGVVAREGWQMWPEADYSKTLYFGEYGNVGEGASTSGRVKWKGFHVIGEEEAEQFTVQNFIAGESWISATGIPFSAGLKG